MPGYLTVDIAHLRRSWQDAALTPQDWPEPVLAVGEQLDYGRKAVTVHVPQPWPTAWFAGTVTPPTPCRVATWGMHLLQAQGWELSDVVDLIEAVQAGEQL